MRGAEVRAVGELAGEALSGAGGLVRDVHAAIARRAFEAAGPRGASARTVHDGVSAVVYGGVRAALGVVPRGAGAALATRTLDEAPLADSPRGALALAVLNAYSGDALHARRSELALDMTLRHRGADVGAIAGATGRVAIFIHGLGETDASWRLRATPERPGYGTLLQRDLGYTPLELRYNSGRRISDNGRALAALLEDLHEGWPQPVEEIVLVGHSMGGLVARSACHYGTAWTGYLSCVFCLGAPHLGAPLEQAANVAGWALNKLPETRPFAKVVNGRSVGIKDLRYGACVEDDWSGCDADEFLRDRCTEVPFLPSADYYFIGASLGKRDGDLVDRFVGDLLVLYTSASGENKKRKIGFQVDRGKRFDGLNHFQLLNHPLVYDQLSEWLGKRPAREASRRALPIPIED
jgi:hypothetical protein